MLHAIHKKLKWQQLSDFFTQFLLQKSVSQRSHGAAQCAVTQGQPGVDKAERTACVSSSTRAPAWREQVARHGIIQLKPTDCRTTRSSNLQTQCGEEIFWHFSTADPIRTVHLSIDPVTHSANSLEPQLPGRGEFGFRVVNK